MNILAAVVTVSQLRQRLIDEMEIRRFGGNTQCTFLRDVGWFATWLGRSPDTATAEDLRRFEVEQRDLGVTAQTMNSIVAAMRFFFTHALDRPDLARKRCCQSYANSSLQDGATAAASVRRPRRAATQPGRPSGIPCSSGDQ
ncbi:phage integrase N-terminal SAM-like domain-containing protein [Sphingomonas sp. GC_Shp_3]|uniref:phage integrase N-terminal SAM-like domain-containing protein n=1 Tax=Sphingomonas sp. GC_Shp_3 TaxID=2937383 RepID=UPI00226A7600|nr:phage integrase N-terminal SAM-like domain-containing protein [Sphingomonas sp. GC_Shp_3]